MLHAGVGIAMVTAMVFAGVDADLLEALELLLGPGDAGDQVADVGQNGFDCWAGSDG